MHGTLFSGAQVCCGTEAAVELLPMCWSLLLVCALLVVVVESSLKRYKTNASESNEANTIVAVFAEEAEDAV